MTSFEDLLTSLRSGASPTESLPRLRALFTSLPTPPQQTTPPTPTCRLFHTLPDGTQVQLPYLRPPFNCWDAFDETDNQEHVFDTEMSMDLYGEMRPRFVEAPSDELMKMLTEWSLGVTQRESEGEKERREPFPAKKKVFGLETIEHAGCDLQRYFRGEMEGVPMVAELSAAEWSVAFSRLEMEGVTCEKLLELLKGIHQREFAEVVLVTILPWLIVGGAKDGVMEVVELAVGKAEIWRMDVNKVRSLLDVYRGLVGVLGGLVMLRVVKSMKRGR